MPVKHGFRSRYGIAAGLLGALLVARHDVLGRLSEQFFYEGALIQSPTLQMVIITGTAGLVCLGLYNVLPNAAATRSAVQAMLGVGLLLRLILFGSTPILTDDFCRHL